MKLYLVRHGKQVSENIDPASPLSEEGKEEVRSVAKELHRMKMNVEQVLHSRKTRAQQTAEIIAEHIDCNLISAIDGIKPLDPIQPIVSLINQEQNDTMLVGHLPFMSNLLTALIGGPSELQIVNFVAGVVCCLSRNATTGWIIEWVVRPDQFLGSD